MATTSTDHRGTDTSDEKTASEFSEAVFGFHAEISSRDNAPSTRKNPSNNFGARFLCYNRAKIFRRRHLITQIIFGDDGTESNPYKINSADDLKQLADAVNRGNDFAEKFFVLTADIDLSGNWTPIGYHIDDGDKKPFRGTFDGCGHTIGNFTIDKPSGDCPGLFGYSGGTIKNCSVSNVTVSGEKHVGKLNVAVMRVYSIKFPDGVTVTGGLELAAKLFSRAARRSPSATSRAKKFLSTTRLQISRRTATISSFPTAKMNR